MNISLDEIAKQPPCFSRAGRMSEALKSSVVSVRTKPKVMKKLDMAKFLSVEDVDGDEAAPKDPELVSSARKHASINQKEKYISETEKAIAFSKSVKNLIPSYRPELPQLVPPPAPVVAPQQKQREDANAASPQPLQRKSKGTPSRVPPVGHYHPSYSAIDVVPYAAFISKPSKRTRSPSKCELRLNPRDLEATALSQRSDSIATPTQSPQGTQGGVIASPSMSLGKVKEVSMSAPQPIVAPVKKKVLEAKVLPSPAFRSKVPSCGSPAREQGSLRRGGSFLGAPREPPRASSVNENVLESTVWSRCFVNMRAEQGREDFEKRYAKPLDLFYDVKLQPPHYPKCAFDRQVPRDADKRLPRTSADVQRSASALDLSQYAKLKYQRQPMAVCIAKQTSRETAVNNLLLRRMEASVGGSEIPPPASLPAKRIPGFKIKNIPGRKAVPPRLAQDVVYEYDIGVVRPKRPDTHISTAPLTRAKTPTCETIAVGVGQYQADSVQRHPRIAKNIEIGKLISRDKREFLSTMGRDKLSNAEYDVKYSLQNQRVKGDPRIATHISREQRMKLSLPDPQFHDAVYDVNPDMFYPPLRKGAVEFQKMLQREKRPPLRSI